ncbi:TrkH family potassium uptake protein [Methanobrevibacter sp. 87.7]|uniref:TrkH family potassium uptake protein n=1 Tax=Methanobrevibacter sp. 87.7 TaxID=387957 RepID=UPI001E30E665|nr:TrkH family potassium uptake protein [Methanobrevibacter sp. 87.7]
MLVPIIIAIFYKETPEIVGFVITSAIALIIGTLFSKIKVNESNIKLKNAMIISTLTWIWASFLSALVMKISLQIPILNGIFENMSSLTGTALCLYTNVEAFPKSILFLKSFEGWLGGLGIVIISVGVIIRKGTAAAKLYKSEARDERIKPSIANTMEKTIEIYCIYTIIGVILYLFAGMHLFDAINLCFASICTGGMSIKNANVGYYNNNLIYIITMVLMIIGTISFPVHYKVFKTKRKAIIDDVQFRAIIGCIIVTSIIIYFLTKAVPIKILFTVISAVTSTGASVLPVHALLSWKDAPLIFLMALMIIGGSSESTSGGVKIIRIITILKGILKNIIEILSPEGRVVKVTIDNKEISTGAIKEAGSYVFIFFILIFFSWVILILHGYDGFRSLFEIISAVSNNGLSAGITNINMSPSVKIVMILDMLMGKLKIIPVLVTIREFFELFKPSNKQKREFNKKVLKK